MPISYQDKMEIQELICHYANCLDSGSFDDWMSCWADDGVWEGGLGVYSGKSALAKLPVDLGSGIRHKRHVMSNFVITGDDSRESATSTCYMIIIERETSTNIVATGVYTDVVKKIGGVWKFVSRKIQLDPGRTAKNPL